VLCDELQEWGRAKVEMIELREVMISKWQFEDDPESVKKIEYLIINLNKFTEKQVLHDNPVKIFDELFQWRQNYIMARGGGFDF
jgi:hypothetical protein